MKNRVRRIANFFAFNLLFFALYLNFIHQEKDPMPGEQKLAQPAAAVSGAVQIIHPETTENK